MSNIGFAFYLVFTGNVLINWGLLKDHDASERQSAQDILIFALLTIGLSILYNFLYSFFLVPMQLLSLSPFILTVLFALGLLGLKALKKLRHGASNGKLDSIWSRNALLFSVVALAASEKSYSLSGFALISCAALAGFLWGNSLLNAIVARIELEPVPAALKGTPIRLISAGLIALAFSGIDVSFFIRLIPV